MVHLLDLAPNCEVAGGASRSVVTTTGTTRIDFAVTCTPLRMIAFSRHTDDANWDIYVSREDGSGAVRLTTAPGADLDPAWSSTGRIAFHSERDGNTDIYVMNADGSAQTRLTNNAAQDYSPAWSPDGSRIAFVSERDGHPAIYVMNADGSSPVRITDTVDGDFDPAWSPDGTKIAFTRGFCGSVSCEGEIYVVTPNGQGLVKITEGGGDGQPAWSPDGAKIAFARLDDCGFYYFCRRNIAMVSSSGGVVTMLQSGDNDEGNPAWSPTGTRLLMDVSSCSYYGCTPFALRTIRLDGGDPVTITSGPVMAPVWRP
jgi:Tol biopolymer transport system component